MERTGGTDTIASLKGCTLLAIPLLVGMLCVSLNLVYPGLQPPALAMLAFAGSFFIAMVTIAGIKIIKMCKAPII